MNFFQQADRLCKARAPQKAYRRCSIQLHAIKHEFAETSEQKRTRGSASDPPGLRGVIPDAREAAGRGVRLQRPDATLTRR